jgi:hypothetical protein
MINTTADTAAELGESKSNVAKELKERLPSWRTQRAIPANEPPQLEAAISEMRL